MAALSSPPPFASKLEGRWLEVVSHTDPKYGGLSSAVPMLGRHVTNQGGFEVTLAAFNAAGEDYWPAGYNAERLSFWPAGRKAWLRHARLRTSFEEQVMRVDGVHIHGLWEQSTATAARTARALNKPYILSAHGMLEPWALATKRWKKLIYGHLVERRNIRGATCLHALTVAEAGHFVRFGAESPIAIIPNGVDVPSVRDSRLFLNRFPALDGKRIILFLARLHAKKGIDLLLEAWKEVSLSFPDAHLVLAGPGSEEMNSNIRQFLRQHQLDASVVVTGMLRDRMKWSALSAAECFVLPSYSEGLSVSVLEAMAMSVPVLITRPCNMPEVVKYKAGWQIEPKVIEVTAALTQILSHSTEENEAVGRCGAALIKERYTWPIVARQMAEVYRWVRGGSMPTTVQFVYPSQL